MWLEAIITQEDLAQILDGFLPVKIHLGDTPEEGKPEPPERWMELKKPTRVVLVPEEGLRVTCPAEVKWTIAGLSPSVKLDELSVLIRPQVVEKNKGYVLELQLEVKEADFHSLPEFIDSPIIKAINPALAAKKIPWNITETLTRTIPLPKMLEPIESLKIDVLWAKTRVNAEALGLVISFKLGFVRND